MSSTMFPNVPFITTEDIVGLTLTEVLRLLWRLFEITFLWCM